ncbi:MAG: hypothetical protein ACRDA9_04355 [Plesiomonas shigelloides]
MRGYRPVLNGMVADLPPDIHRECIAFFKSYIRSCQDHEFLTDPGAIQSLIGRIKQVTGRSFYEFACVNYETGHGRRSRIFRHIAQYMRGELSGRMFTTYMHVEQDLVREMQQTNTPFAGKALEGSSNENYKKVLEMMNEKTLYAILACIGPSDMCRWMLTFFGEFYDGQY